MKRVGDFSEPWRCPPSLVRVFAKRRAIQALREIKGAAARQAEQRRRGEPELATEQFFAAYRAHRRTRTDG